MYNPDNPTLRPGQTADIGFSEEEPSSALLYEACPFPLAGPSSRVLLLEADPEYTRAQQAVLQEAGFVVDAVEDGRQALQALLKHDYCVVVADATSPGMSGLDLLRCVRVHDLDVAVVLVTEPNAFATAAEALRYGARQLLVKPVPPRMLMSEVRRASKLHELAVRQRQAMRLLAADQAEQTYRRELNEAVDRGLRSLRMAYQPIVTADGEVFGYEALLRTGEPRFKSPLEFIEAVEEVGRLKEMGRACRAAAVRGFAEAPKDALLFVNLHVYDLLDPDLLDSESLLSRMASRVVLELTERASIDRVPDVHVRIRTLRAMGFRIAIDDLGCGYAGLNSIVQIEPEFVKLDMSLVRDVQNSPIKHRLIALMASACRELSITVIAEGVETREEWAALQKLDCPCFQGYLFGRPAPFKQAEAEQRSARSSLRPVSGCYTRDGKKEAANDKKEAVNE